MSWEVFLLAFVVAASLIHNLYSELKNLHNTTATITTFTKIIPNPKFSGFFMPSGNQVDS